MSSCDTIVLFAQNHAGFRKWPPTAACVAALRRAFASELPDGLRAKALRKIVETEEAEAEAAKAVAAAGGGDVQADGDEAEAESGDVLSGTL